MVGGAGDDTAVFSGRYTDYQFAVTDETLSIIGADGTDTLLEMEYLHFLGDVDTDLVRVDHLMAMLKDQQRRTSNALSSMMAYTNESGRLALVIATQCCQQTHHATH